MTDLKVVAIGDCVHPVETWNPLKAAGDDAFTYVDLSAIDQERKQIVEARSIACADAPSRAKQLVKEGDVLVSTVRPNLNGVARVGIEHHGATASTGFCVLRPTAAKLDGSYAFQWVKSPGFVADMVSKATGASYPAVSDRIILESRIPLPPLPEQRRIAAILDHADALKAKRREALAQLDSLTQSIFTEMFGGVLSSGKRTAMGELVSEFRYGTSEKSGGDGYPALRIPNVANGHLDLRGLKTVAVEPAEFNRLQLKAGDLLFVRTNGNPENVGRCAVFEPSLVAGSGFDPGKFIYASYLIRARLKRESVSPVVLQQYLHVGEGRHALRAVCKTSAGQYNINTEGLGSIPIPSFPPPLQHCFATRIKAVESLKATHRTALAESDALFASLQHRAFAGQLS